MRRSRTSGADAALAAADRSAAGPEALLAASPLRAIARLAAPTTVVMLVASASNVLATYFVSRLGGDAIAAVALVFPLALLATTATGGGLGTGVASAVARALGAGRRAEASRIAEHATVLIAALGLALGAVVLVWAPAIFGLMGGRGDVLAAATLYGRILLGGQVITFSTATLDSILRGEGNVRVSSIWSSVSLTLQIFLTPVFMFGLGLGLAGAPIAVLASQLTAMVPRARFVYGGRGFVQPALWPRRLATAPFAEILRVGVPAALSTTVNYLGLMVLTAVIARLGEAHLAAYGLGTRLDFLLLSFMFGIAAAVLTLVGLATGARRPDLAATYVLRACLLMVALLVGPAVLLARRPDLWFQLFTDDPAILAVGGEYFRLIGPSYPFVGISMILAFGFQAVGRATLPFVWMTIRTVVVLAVALVCTRWLGMADRAVFATVAAGNVLSAVVMAALFVAAERRRRAG